VIGSVLHDLERAIFSRHAPTFRAKRVAMEVRMACDLPMPGRALTNEVSCHRLASITRSVASAASVTSADLLSPARGIDTCTGAMASVMLSGHRHRPFRQGGESRRAVGAIARLEIAPLLGARMRTDQWCEACGPSTAAGSSIHRLRLWPNGPSIPLSGSYSGKSTAIRLSFAPRRIGASSSSRRIEKTYSPFAMRFFPY